MAPFAGPSTKQNTSKPVCKDEGCCSDSASTLSAVTCLALACSLVLLRCMTQGHLCACACHVAACVVVRKLCCLQSDPRFQQWEPWRPMWAMCLLRTRVCKLTGQPCAMYTHGCTGYGLSSLILRVIVPPLQPALVSGPRSPPGHPPAGQSSPHP